VRLASEALFGIYAYFHCFRSEIIFHLQWTYEIATSNKYLVRGIFVSFFEEEFICSGKFTLVRWTAYFWALTPGKGEEAPQPLELSYPNVLRLFATSLTLSALYSNL